ncbi:MAG TPA: alpha/beta hydrolase [Woeseiaceae bacterium]|nr:alpha/beta hydrolase [Woeseiaceae bacterium]
MSASTIPSSDLRHSLLAGLPVAERRMTLANLHTAVLECGDGPPMLLLHGPAASAAHWMQVIPSLVATHRVIAPDLPGHGASQADGALDAGRVLSWLGELIDLTCESPPVIVGQLSGGAIAARFAAGHGEEIRRLVLVDTFGLCPFQPAPGFGEAVMRYLSEPSTDTHWALWQHCAFDLGRLHRRMGSLWAAFEAYNVDRARAPGAHEAVGALMESFALQAIEPGELAGIRVPVSLVWGRHDRATPLSVAEAASARYGWPLHVIEESADDPPVEQPEAFVRVLERLAENRAA